MAAERISEDMTLEQLLEGIAGDVPAIGIRGIQTDSRELREGDLFMACAGGQEHAIRYAAQAIAAGVSAIIYDSDTAEQPDVVSDTPVIGVPALAAHIGEIADRWFATPSLDVEVCGVTGTNGKTTVAWLLSRALGVLQRKSGYVGTLGAGIDELDYDSGLTTPSCISLHRTLADFRERGATNAVIEVSSHGLDQQRVDGIRFESALFTNLSRDHIDYHGDMQSYFEAKASLFDRYQPNHRVINIDDEYGQELSRRCGPDAITVAVKSDSSSAHERFIAARDLKLRSTGVDVAFDSSWGNGEIHLPLVGEFNVSNALMVLAELLRQDISVEDACAALASVGAPPGRLQRVAIAGREALPATYVDFAHTPEALRVALETLGAHRSGRIWCLFGCGGDRDRGKRPEMGRIASELADVAIVTNDNPRNEQPSDIVRDIVSGMQGEPQVIEDRGAAIAFAIREADDNDTILIAGKGHEEKQIIGNQALPFSDYQSALFNLKVRTQQAGGVQ